MDVSILIEVLPDSVKTDIMAFNYELLKGKSVTRVFLNRLLTEEEKAKTGKCKNIFEINRVWYRKSFPNKKMSVFVVAEFEE